MSHFISFHFSIRVVSWSRRRGRRRSTVWTRRPGNGPPELPGNTRTSSTTREWDDLRSQTFGNRQLSDWLTCLLFYFLYPPVPGGVRQPRPTAQRAGATGPGVEDRGHQRKHSQGRGASTLEPQNEFTLPGGSVLALPAAAEQCSLPSTLAFFNIPCCQWIQCLMLAGVVLVVKVVILGTFLPQWCSSHTSSVFTLHIARFLSSMYWFSCSLWLDLSPFFGPCRFASSHLAPPAVNFVPNRDCPVRPYLTGEVKRKGSNQCLPIVLPLFFAPAGIFVRLTPLGCFLHLRQKVVISPSKYHKCNLSHWSANMKLFPVSILPLFASVCHGSSPALLGQCRAQTDDEYLMSAFRYKWIHLWANIREL